MKFAGHSFLRKKSTKALTSGKQQQTLRSLLFASLNFQWTIKNGIWQKNFAQQFPISVIFIFLQENHFSTKQRWFYFVIFVLKNDNLFHSILNETYIELSLKIKRKNNVFYHQRLNFDFKCSFTANKKNILLLCLYIKFLTDKKNI